MQLHLERQCPAYQSNKLLKSSTLILLSHDSSFFSNVLLSLFSLTSPPQDSLTLLRGLCAVFESESSFPMHRTYFYNRTLFCLQSNSSPFLFSEHDQDTHELNLQTQNYMNCRNATFREIFQMQHCNLNNLPENYSLRYYLYHYFSDPEMLQVAEVPGKGKICGYVMSKMFYFLYIYQTRLIIRIILLGRIFQR